VLVRGEEIQKGMQARFYKVKGLAGAHKSLSDLDRPIFLQVEENEEENLSNTYLNFIPLIFSKAPEDA
jgi:hypothetical protein